MKEMIDSMRNELCEEASTTQRVLERVPANKLAWKPHPKSMSLGQLSLHVASIPGNLAKLVQMEEFELPASRSRHSQRSSLDSGPKRSDGGAVSGWNDRAASKGQLASYDARARGFQQAEIGCS